MNKHNQKKADQLGMPIGTASARLRKTILWQYIVHLKHNVCFQCQKEILSEADLSIEHKEPWLDSSDPVERFFNLDNIAYSHLSCNIAAGRKVNISDIPFEERNRRNAKKSWENLGQDEQKKRRREKYLKYGC